MDLPELLRQFTTGLSIYTPHCDEFAGERVLDASAGAWRYLRAEYGGFHDGYLVRVSPEGRPTLLAQRWRPTLWPYVNSGFRVFVHSNFSPDGLPPPVREVFLHAFGLTSLGSSDSGWFDNLGPGRLLQRIEGGRMPRYFAIPERWGIAIPYSVRVNFCGGVGTLTLIPAPSAPSVVSATWYERTRGFYGVPPVNLKGRTLQPLPLP